MTAWTRPLGTAVERVALDRAVLLPAAVVYLLGLGWLSLPAGLLPAPDPGGVAYFGISLLTASAFPWNVVVLAGSALAALAAWVLILGAGEALILARLSPRARRTDRSFAMAGGLALGAVPAMLTLVPLTIALIGAVPVAYAHPDPARSFWLQVGVAVMPWLVPLAVAAVIGQAFGAVLLREIDASNRAGLPVRRALARLADQPARLIGIAAAGATLLVGWTIAVAILVGSLWQSLAPRLAGEGVGDPLTIGLLFGMVAIWLALVGIGGATQAIVSAWWSETLRRDP